MTAHPASGSARLSIPISESDYSQGPADAPVQIVEYGDYECPHCQRFHPIVRELLNLLGDDIQYTFRHFPIRSQHPHAQFAAEAAEAAGAQGKFWEMHNYFFDHEILPSREEMIEFARSLRLDIDQFNRDLDTHRFEDRVQDDFVSGVRSGVNGTPSIYINGLRYDGPWDLESLLEEIKQPLGVQIRRLAQEFTRIEASGGILLLLFTLLALVLANSPLASFYTEVWDMHLGISLGGFHLEESLLHWVNDGLMVIFFFVVGLEIKREITSGHLASPHQAALPIAAALGGMIMPALLYALLNFGGAGEAGWGVPVATDIAFALGVMAVLGRRVPLSLKVFFTAMAIADDIGAVLVIALFYSEGIVPLGLVIGGLLVVVLFLLNRARVYQPLPYVLVGLVLWFTFLESGLHPTIAGIILALFIPTRAPVNSQLLMAQCINVMDDMGQQGIWRGQAYHNAVSTLEAITERMLSPAQRLERDLLPWSTYLIMPVFALANAGVNVTSGSGGGLTSPISLGIILGLVVGKPAGVLLFSFVAVRMGWARLPDGVSWQGFFGAAWLAGIGFTLSLFIAGSAFPQPELLDTAKMGILIASALATALGVFFLWTIGPTYHEITQANGDIIALADIETAPSRVEGEGLN